MISLLLSTNGLWLILTHTHRSQVIAGIALCIAALIFECIGWRLNKVKQKWDKIKTDNIDKRLKEQEDLIESLIKERTLLRSKINILQNKEK